MISFVLKFIVVTIFLLSGVSKILSFNGTLIYLVGIFRVSPQILTILLWILIVIELVVPVIILMDGYQSIFVFRSIQFLLITFLITNILFLVYGLENCGCFGTRIQSYPINGIVKTVILLIILSYLRKIKLVPLEVSNNGQQI